jgi:hypothetical protein
MFTACRAFDGSKSYLSTGFQAFRLFTGKKEKRPFHRDNKSARGPTASKGTENVYSSAHEVTCLTRLYAGNGNEFRV